jgi:CheY-like chemotaxis protein
MAHILLIEDSTAQRELFADFLREDGHTVSTAASGDEGMELLESLSPDLLVMDILMPGLDGISAVREVLRKSPDTPIILHTAYPQYQKTLGELRVNAVVVKSCDPQPLKAKIAEVLQQQSQDIRQSPAGGKAER